ncbi:MAG: hypothetical protein U5L96_09850 [Owenweeksia sp.]|nr:hypothetical protein [Owenweeksia sp.]
MYVGSRVSNSKGFKNISLYQPDDYQKFAEGIKGVARIFSTIPTASDILKFNWMTALLDNLPSALLNQVDQGSAITSPSKVLDLILEQGFRSKNLVNNISSWTDNDVGYRNEVFGFCENYTINKPPNSINPILSLGASRNLKLNNWSDVPNEIDVYYNGGVYFNRFKKDTWSTTSTNWQNQSLFGNEWNMISLFLARHNNSIYPLNQDLNLHIYISLYDNYGNIIAKDLNEHRK